MIVCELTLAKLTPSQEHVQQNEEFEGSYDEFVTGLGHRHQSTMVLEDHFHHMMYLFSYFVQSPYYIIKMHYKKLINVRGFC
jgi:hypothetical protein